MDDQNKELKQLAICCVEKLKTTCSSFSGDDYVMGAIQTFDNYLLTWDELEIKGYYRRFNLDPIIYCKSKATQKLAGTLHLISDTAQAIGKVGWRIKYAHLFKSFHVEQFYCDARFSLLSLSEEIQKHTHTYNDIAKSHP